VRAARALAATVVLAVAAFPAPAAADLTSDLSEVQGRVDELRTAVSGTEGERSDLAGLILDTGARLDVLSVELAEATAALAETEREIAVANEAIAELDETIARREAAAVDLRYRVDGARRAAIDRAVQLYMATEEPATLAVDGLQSQAVGTVYAGRLEALARADIARFEALRSAEEELVGSLAAERTERRAQVTALDQRRAVRQARADDVAARSAEVEALLVSQEALLADLDSRIEEIEGEIAALEREQAWIEELIRQETSSSGARPEGILFRPVPGAVSSGFGPRVHPIYGDLRMHTGVDMNAGCGAEIRASEAGRVFLSDWKGGYGLTVMIDHGGGMSTLYAHQTSTAVGYGQQVARGEVIGYIGTTGVSTGCHLHYEVRLGGTPVDPAPYL